MAMIMNLGLNRLIQLLISKYYITIPMLHFLISKTKAYYAPHMVVLHMKWKPVNYHVALYVLPATKTQVP